MIRPFDLRDIPLVRRLAGHGVALDSRAALTETHRPLRDAMLAYLIAGRGAPTFVLRLRQPDVALHAFGQLRMCPGRHQAQLVTQAVLPGGHEPLVWPRMLDALTAEAGRCGAHAVLAEINDTGPAFEALRQADFVVYTRQEIWRLESPVGKPAEEWLRPERPDDRWHVRQLIANTVPRLIQEVEAADPTGPGLVWVGKAGLLAYAHIHRGPRGYWMQLYLHPQAEDAARSLIEQTIARFPPTTGTAFYCCVRRHQEWLTRPLIELGFEPLGCQAAMVRHTTVREAQSRRQLVPAREKGLEATLPVSQARSLQPRERKDLANPNNG